MELLPLWLTGKQLRSLDRRGGIRSDIQFQFDLEHGTPLLLIGMLRVNSERRARPEGNYGGASWLPEAGPLP